MKRILLLFLLALGCLSVISRAQNVRYDSPFPSISPNSPPFLVANVPPNSPTLQVCQSPANGVPCTNYAQTFTSTASVCPNGAQDTPQPQPSACQSTGDAQGNIGFWAPAGKYDYTVCISNNCFGPYTVTLGGSGGGGSPNQAVSFTNATSATLAIGSGNVTWDCWDTANHVLQPSVMPPVSPSYIITFLFFFPQSGFCVVNSSGGGGGGSSLRSCQTGLGDGLNSITAASYQESFCYNDSGAAWNLTALRCYSDNSGSSTMTATDNLGNSLLTGPIACSPSFAAGTQSSTTTILGGGFIKFSFAADGTTKQSSWVVSITE